MNVDTSDSHLGRNGPFCRGEWALMMQELDPPRHPGTCLLRSSLWQGWVLASGFPLCYLGLLGVPV